MRDSSIETSVCPRCLTPCATDGSCACADLQEFAPVRPSIREPREESDSAPRATPQAPPRWREILLPCAIGGALAPLLSVGPVLGFMGWFLASLVHELGHCAISWFMGTPAIPAISLQGHAAAAHGLQIPALSYAVWAGLAGGVYWLRDQGNWPWVCALAALCYPALAFTSLGETTFLLAGHLSEVIFAGIFLHRCIAGGMVTGSKTERALAGLLAWHLFARNIRLCGGLLWDESVRRWYEQSGSFGLTNDFLRVSNDLLHVPLDRVAAGMLAFAVLTLIGSFSTAVAVARRPE